MYLKRLRRETVHGPPVLVGAERGPHAPVMSTQMIASGERDLLLGAEKVEVAAAGDRTVSEPRPARREVRQPAPESIAAQKRAQHGVRPRLLPARWCRKGAVEQVELCADIIGTRLVAAEGGAQTAA